MKKLFIILLFGFVRAPEFFLQTQAHHASAGANGSVVIFDGFRFGPTTVGTYTWGASQLTEVAGAGVTSKYNALKWIQGDEWGNGWSGWGKQLNIVNFAPLWMSDSIQLMLKAESGVGLLRIQLASPNGKVGKVFQPTADNQWHRYIFALRELTYMDGATSIDSTAINSFDLMAEASAVAGKVVFLTNIWAGNPVIDTIPSPPKNLVAQVLSSSSIRLTWDPPSDTLATLYHIYRTGAPGPEFTRIDSVVSSTTQYTDKWLAQNTTYLYRVTAGNHFGESAPSNEDTAKTIADDSVLVTFILNTSTLADTINANSFVQIRGGHSLLGSWSYQSPARMSNVTGDYWTTTMKFKRNDSTEYKFFVNAAPSINETNRDAGWENNSLNVNGNRFLRVGISDTVLPVQYFLNGNNDQYWRPYNETDSIEVLLRVNIAKVNGFNKNDHYVGVRGNFGQSQWASTVFLTREQDAGNGITQYDYTNFYSGVVRIPKPSASSTLAYKFVIHQTLSSTGDPLLWENISNRTMPIHPAMSDTTVRWDWMNGSLGAAQLNLRDNIFDAKVFSANGPDWNSNIKMFYRSSIGWKDSSFSGTFERRIFSSGGIEKLTIDAHPSENATVAEYSFSNPGEISGYFSLRDGRATTLAKVRFVIQVKELQTYTTVLDSTLANVNGWRYFKISLAQWAGKGITVRLITDPAGTTAEDWAQWAEVVIKSFTSVSPDPPTDLTATAVSSNQISLSWNPPSTGNTLRYNIYRTTNVASGYSFLDSVSASQTTYANTGLTQNTTYWYGVTAVNNNGESSPSNQVSATTWSSEGEPAIHKGFALPYRYILSSGDTAWTVQSNARGIFLSPDLDKNGKPELIVTDYSYSGRVHVFEAAGNDSVRWIWSSPRLDLAGIYGSGGSSTPRVVKTGDLDGDGKGEIIFPREGYGILIFEWNGIIGSRNFGSIPSAAIRPSDIPGGALGLRMEQMEILDIDKDGKEEIIFPSNVSNNDLDDFFVISANGTWEYESQGSATFSVEWSTNGRFRSWFGGGSPYSFQPADLDGNGSMELIAQSWYFGTYFTVKVTGPNTYQIADTNRVDRAYQITAPDDMVSIFGGSVFDLDNDGNQELYYNWFGGNQTWSGDISVIDYSSGNDVLAAGALFTGRLSNRMLNDVNGNAVDGLLKPIIGDIDGNGKNEIITGSYYPNRIVSLEYKGGPVKDSLSYSKRLYYRGTVFDAQTAEIRNFGNGRIDTLFIGGASFMKSTPIVDFDGDGDPEMISTVQGLSDQIQITYTRVDGANLITDSIRSIRNPQPYVIYSMEFPRMNKTAPAVPGNVSAALLSSTRIRVSWNASTSGNPALYRVYRSQSDKNHYVILKEVGANQLFIIDSTVMPQTTYWYKITAINTNGESPASTEVSVTTSNRSSISSLSVASNAAAYSKLVPIAFSLNVLNQDTIDLNCYFTPSTDLQRRTAVSLSGNIRRLTQNTVDTLYWDCSLDFPGNETDVIFTIVPVSQQGIGDSLSSGKFFVDGIAPRFSGVAQSVSSGTTVGAVQLRWKKAIDAIQPVSYLIYAADSSNGFTYASPISTTFDTAAVVKNLKQNKRYFFSVRAKDTAGNIDTNTAMAASTLPMLSDLNGDSRVGAADLLLFKNAWLTNDTLAGDIGPAIGVPPDWQSLRDHKVDFEDVMVLAMGWKWSVAHPAPFLPKMENQHSDSTSKLFTIPEQFIVKNHEKKIIELPLIIEPSVAGIDVAFLYDTSKVSIDSIEYKNDSRLLFFHYINNTSGIVRMSFIGFSDSLSNVMKDAKMISLWISTKQQLENERISIQAQLYDAGSQLLTSLTQALLLSGKPKIPEVFALSQNYPNPFNPVTKIDYQLPVDTKVTVKIYNLLGQEIETLLEEFRKAGYYSIHWNASKYSSGIYFLRFTSQHFLQTRKLLLVK